ncbi:MAG: hypothetical protein C5B52_11525 [Bacteroidetes bacterium]|nr:MAG: hypothetical protein C5B52_11525 [Bacteroidota bacterium]
MQSSAQQVFSDRDRVYPGETVMASITLASPNYFEGALSVGMEFEFGEGNRIIETGVLTQIINPSLKKL